jgi:hypothetical protein
MGDEDDKEALTGNSRSGGNDPKDAPATMAKGEKPSSDKNSNDSD